MMETRKEKEVEVDESKKAINEEIEKGQVDGGKFLTFMLKGEEYGVEILTVREIIGIIDITSVPQTPPYVKGVINLRGKVIPIIDLRLKFKIEETEYTNETCIIVVDVNNILMGIVVDTVSEVINIDSADVEPAPSFGEKINTEYIMGIGKMKGEVKILLDVSMVLTSEDFVILEDMLDVASA